MRLIALPLLAGLTLLLAGCAQSTTATPVPDGDETPKAAGKSDATAQQADTPEELLPKAGELAQDGDLDGAMKVLDEALAQKPDLREALLMKAAIFQLQADQTAAKDRAASVALYARSADAMRKLAASHDDLRPQERGFLVQALFNEARGLAHQGQADEAMVVLREATAAGLDVPEALEDDEDLDKLADRPDFQALKAELVEKAEAYAREQARELLASQEPFDFSFTLPDLKDQQRSLDDLRGKTVTIVDVWGTWCPPCRVEIPHFIALYEQYQDQGLEIIGVTYEQTEDLKKARGQVETFLKEVPIPYPLVLTDGAILDSIPDFQGFPTTLFLDAEGKVRATLVGAHPKRDLEAVVVALLSEQAGADPSAPAPAAPTPDGGE